MSARPIFVVLDGLDGCGKTTQAELLAAFLSERSGREALHLREPGSTLAGERIRGLLLEPGIALEPAAQVLLFAAARRQMLTERVAPALTAGRDVVCERFHASTVAYQGAALGVGEARVLELLTAWAGSPAPDLTVVLDLAPEEAEGRRGRSDRFEGAGAEFHRRVAGAYRAFAERHPRVALISARGTREAVAARIHEELHRAGL